MRRPGSIVNLFVGLIAALGFVFLILVANTDEPVQEAQIAQLPTPSPAATLPPSNPVVVIDRYLKDFPGEARLITGTVYVWEQGTTGVTMPVVIQHSVPVMPVVGGPEPDEAHGPPGAPPSP